MNNQNNKMVYVIGGIVVLLVLVMLFSSTMFSGYRNGGPRMMNGDGNQITGNIDQHFIEQMIPHHDGAIAMANLALEKSNRPEIKTLAQAILAAQAKENKEMKAWYKDWFGKEVVVEDGASSGGMMSGDGMHMGGNSDIDDLKSASDFDKEFIEQMIPHHQMAIMMARMLETGTNRTEMQQLAKNIINSQAEEIQKMQGWYAIWYQ